ncbi:MAG: hypothetical protein ABGW87_13205 [Sphingomonadaceae bacterium]
MTLPISINISADTPKIAPAGGGAKGAKTAGKPGETGFAKLVSKASAKDEKQAGNQAAGQTRQDEPAKTGKILPVGKQALADTLEKGAANSEDDTAENTSPATANLVGIVDPVALPGIVKVAATPMAEAKPTKASEPSAKPTAQPLQPGVQTQAHIARPELAGAKPEPDTTKPARPQVETGTVKLAVEAIARLANSGPDKARPATVQAAVTQAEPAKPQIPAPRPVGFTLNIAAADKATGHGSTGNNADSNTDHANADSAEPGADKLFAGMRSLTPNQPARLFELAPVQHLATRPVQDGASPAVASNAAPAQTAMSAEGIAHFVDRIAMARSFDMAQPASLMVNHKDFGQLTVTFDHVRGGLDVQIAAQDAETQRALTSAMAQDRNIMRHGEAQTSVQASHSASAGGERDASSSGQSFASHGQGQSNGRTSDQSSGHAFSHTPSQTRRPSGAVSNRSTGTSQTSSDDALYA